MSDNGRPQIKVRLEYVTPEKAGRWLKHNVHNRALNGHRVKALAGALSRGEWRVTSQGVGFNLNGDLDDGQHRLQAIVQSGVGAWLIIVRDLEPEAQEVVDMGQARTLGQTLSLRGEPRANQVAAALRIVYAYRAYGDPYQSVAGTEVTKQQFIALLESDPEIRNSLQPAAAAQVKGVSLGMITGLHYLFTRTDTSLTETFFAALTSGENLTKADPAWHLRKSYAKQAALQQDRRFGGRLMAMLTVKAWNAYVLNREIRQLKADRREDFPQIITAEELAAA